MRQIVDIKDVLNIFSASQFKVQSEEKKEMALPYLSRPGRPTNLTSRPGAQSRLGRSGVYRLAKNELNIDPSCSCWSFVALRRASPCQCVTQILFGVNTRQHQDPQNPTLKSLS
jgi:hypothetical protein